MTLQNVASPFYCKLHIWVYQICPAETFYDLIHMKSPTGGDQFSLLGVAKHTFQKEIQCSVEPLQYSPKGITFHIPKDAVSVVTLD